MRRILAMFSGLAIFSVMLFSLFLPETAHAAASDNAIASRSATVEGIKLHYLTAGHGTDGHLFHGYAETSLMWRPLIPKLAISSP